MTLNAAHVYTMQQYGFAFLNNPIDRARIKNIIILQPTTDGIDLGEPK